MYFFARSKVSMLPSVVTIVAIMSALVMTLVSQGPTTHASSSTIFHGTHSTTTSIQRGLFIMPPPKTVHPMSANLPQRSIDAGGDRYHFHATGTGAPQTASSSLNHSSVVQHAVLNNFNGLSNLDSANDNGLLVEPPDQGLCVGKLFGTVVVSELVNLSVTFYNPDGTGSGSQSLNTFFAEPTSELTTDPRCYYDTATQTYFFTVLAINFTTHESHVDIKALRQNLRQIEVKLDTTDASNTNCPCIGDQPHLGIDQNNLYISVDEFPLGPRPYNGAALYALSKSNILAGGVVNIASYVNLHLAGVPILTLQPAITNSAAQAEFMMNTFPIANSNFVPNPIDNNIGLWALTNGTVLSTGGVPTLAANIFTSELYAFPIPATSPGTFLNPDDDRMQQVQFINGQLWGAFNTAVITPGDPATRDGIAWLQLTPGLSGVSPVKKALSQGYIAVAEAYLLYPAIETNAAGATTIAFTATTATSNPAAAYVTKAAGATSFGNPQIAALGSGGYDPNGGRWGDYSAAALDPNGSGLWMATEYIPPAASTTPVLNWGTRVFEVSAT